MNNRGFTLLETLVALVIVTVIGAAAYRGGVALMVVRAGVTPRLDRIKGVDRFFALVERDLTSLASRPWRSESATLMPPFHADRSKKPSGAFMSLARFASPHDVGVPGVVGVVGYRFAEGRLDYLVWPAPDRSSLSRPEAYRLLDDIADMTVSFLDQEGEWQESWIDLAPPRLLSMTLILSGGATLHRIFRVGA